MRLSIRTVFLTDFQKGASSSTTTTTPSSTSNSTTPPAATSSTTTVSSSTLRQPRPFRVNRRRLVTTTTEAGATVASEESLQDLEDRDSFEDPALKPRAAALKKTVKIQRRPLTSLRTPDIDQNPSATNEEKKGHPTEAAATSKEDGKRQSKKYSSSFKQNQLNEVLRQKSQSSEVVDSFTDGTTVEDLSPETAIAIATHQLLTAPVPSLTGYEEPKTTPKKPNSFYPTTKQYLKEEFPNKNDHYTQTGVTYSSTPIYTGVSETFGLSTGLPKTSSYAPLSTYTSAVRKPSGFTSNVGVGLGPSTARYIGSSDKYFNVPIDEGYATDSYVGGISQEPVYFTREYLLESPVTRTYDDEYQYLSPITTLQPQTTRKPIKKTVYKKISTTIRPTSEPVARAVTTTRPVASPVTTARPVASPVTTRLRRPKPFEKVTKAPPPKTYEPIENYDYYDDSHEKLAGKYAEGVKVVLHNKGTIECLDIGNFPHPTSCKKFISCARMEGGSILGWEYICPKGLSFDPVGGICNWSAGLGCEEQ